MSEENEVTDDLPLEIENYSDIRRERRNVYEYTDFGTYRLTHGGRQLRNVRTLLEDGDIRRSYFFRFGKTVPIDIAEWTRTLSAATPVERKALLQLAAAGKIAVKR